MACKWCGVELNLAPSHGFGYSSGGAFAQQSDHSTTMECFQALHTQVSWWQGMAAGARGDLERVRSEVSDHKHARAGAEDRERLLKKDHDLLKSSAKGLEERFAKLQTRETIAMHALREVAKTLDRPEPPNEAEVRAARDCVSAAVKSLA